MFSVQLIVFLFDDTQRPTKLLFFPDLAVIDKPPSRYKLILTTYPCISAFTPFKALSASLSFLSAIMTVVSVSFCPAFLALSAGFELPIVNRVGYEHKIAR